MELRLATPDNSAFKVADEPLVDHTLRLGAVIEAERHGS